MKIAYMILMLAAAGLACQSEKGEVTGGKTSPEVSFYDFKIPSLAGDTIDFSRYKGKKVLIVNTASECGFTPQYAELQKLHEKYGDKVAVLGFPCNQFGNQEPGNNEEISRFCKKNYGVTFQMFAKTEVKGPGKSALYRWLTEKELNGWNEQEPTWNFCKYLIDEKGQLIKFFSSKVSPLDDQITRLL